MSESFQCPRRVENPGPWKLPESDEWSAEGTCSYCGSLSGDTVMEHLKNGVEIHPTDKSYKLYLMAPDPKAGQSRIFSTTNERDHPGDDWVPVDEQVKRDLERDGWIVGDEYDDSIRFVRYCERKQVEQRKFYFQHFSVEQRKEFVELLNSGRMNIGYPGYFYTLPFFIKREVAA